MAEVLGIVAAAVQLTETAHKLRELSSGIRNAPAVLASLVEDVAVLADVLASIDYGAYGGLVTPHSGLTRCQTLFQGSLMSMRQLTTDLEKLLQSHRVSGAVRIYLKKDELASCKSRLESIKTTLVLAQQTYYSAVLARQNEQLLQEVRAVAMFQQAQHSASPQAIAVQSVTNDTATDEKVQDIRRMNKWTLRSARKSKTEYSIRLPAWMFSRCFNILIDRGNSSWGITFRTYNRLPESSAVLQAVERGDWAGVQDMFRAGTASPYDTDSHGWDLLYFAATQMNPSACAMLLDHGLDPTSTPQVFGYDAITTVNDNSWCWENTDREMATRVSETLTLLLSHPNAILEAETSYLTRYFHLLWPEHLQLLVNAVVPPYASLDCRSRARVAEFVMVPCPESFNILLGPNFDLSHALEPDREGGANKYFRLLKPVVRGLAEALALHQETNEESEKWRDILSMLVRQGLLDCAYAINSSLLARFIFYYYHTHSRMTQRRHLWQQDGLWVDFLNEVTHIWVGVLQSVGVDLEAYGKAERDYISEERGILEEGPVFNYVSQRGQSSVWFEIRYLTYGPRVEDWKLYVVEVQDCRGGRAEYEIAGEFWDWIENPELFEIPGAFLPG